MRLLKLTLGPWALQLHYWTEGDGKKHGLKEGEVLVSNHPQLAGGSHLPDITVITPVFDHGRIVFCVASRGHHQDVGGTTPGSMPPNSQNLAEEGAAILAFKLVENGKFQVSLDSFWVAISISCPTCLQACHACREPMNELSYHSLVSHCELFCDSICLQCALGPTAQKL